MNLSIFNFRTPAPAEARGQTDAAAWRRFNRLAILCAVGFSLSVYLLLIIADPYDTGRFFRWPIGIADSSPRTANASRGRDPRFNAAVIGSSRGQLLDPARLSALTGRSFVQLTVPAAQPREQLTLLHWFKRHHADIAAIVVVADESWCTSDPSLPITYPFPFWLYADNNIDYLKSIMRSQAFDRLWRRTRVALHLLRPSDPAGYWNYDPAPDARVDWQSLEQPAPLLIDHDPRSQVPAVERLRDEIANVSPMVPIIIVVPPVFHSSLPTQGSPEEARIAYCKGKLADLAASRARGAFIDFFEDGPIARDPNNFLDHVHYRQGVARKIEQSIAKAMTGG